MEETNQFDPSQFEDYKLHTLLNIIIQTQQNRNLIRLEFERLKLFYKNNLPAFYESLQQSQEKMLQKEELSDFEIESIEKIDKILSDKESINSLLAFRDDLFLDDFFKVYRQIANNNNSENILDKEYLEILFYSLSTVKRDDENVPVGSYFKDGTINTGTDFQLSLIRVTPTDFFETYAAYMN